MPGKAPKAHADIVLQIRLSYDDVAGVWYVAESDIPGLRREGYNPDELAIRCGSAIVALTDAMSISRRRTEGNDDER